MARTGRGREVSIEKLRKEYLAALDWYDEAAAELPAALQASNHSLAAVRAQARAGLPMKELLAELEPDRRRSRLSAAIDDLVRARHEAQRSLYGILVAEGMSMSDVARAFGISRGLVSRFVNEQKT